MAAHTLGVGILGCGNISGIYLRNAPLFAGLELRACASRTLASARRAAEPLGLPAVSVPELLARDDIDIVVNLTPPNDHAALTRAALEAGKHVYSEKPLTVSVADAKHLLALAESKGLALGCAPDTFLGGGHQLCRQVIDSGRIGRVLAGTAMVLSHGMEHWHPDPEFFFKPGGGPVLDLGPYYLTALVNLLGPVARIQAHGQVGQEERLVTAPGPRHGQRITVETLTHVTALLDFAAGAQITLMASWDIWKNGHPPIELYGTAGSLRIPDPNWFGGTPEVSDRDGPWQPLPSHTLPFGAPNYRGPHWPAERPDQANYRALGIADLASSLRAGTPHRSSARLALHVLEVMDGILAACATGTAVTLAPGIARPPPLAAAEAAALLA
jgi:predicted dehydrogenase